MNLKNRITELLREDLKYWYSGNATKDKFDVGIKNDIVAESNKNIVAYHGSPHKISSFSDEFVGGKEATDQEGPGIYFTTSVDEARKYTGDGGYLYKVQLTPKKLLSDDPNFDLDYLNKPITQLIKMAPNWKQVARGYDEGIDEMIYKYVGMSQSEKEAFVNLFNDVYSNNAVSYVRNMVKLGYDGVYLPSRDGGAHIVIYNLSVIKLLDIEKIN